MLMIQAAGDLMKLVCHQFDPIRRGLAGQSKVDFKLVIMPMPIRGEAAAKNTLILLITPQVLLVEVSSTKFCSDGDTSANLGR